MFAVGLCQLGEGEDAFFVEIVLDLAVYAVDPRQIVNLLWTVRFLLRELRLFEIQQFLFEQVKLIVEITNDLVWIGDQRRPNIQALHPL